MLKQTSDNLSIQLSDLPFIFTFKVPQVVLGDTKRKKIPQHPHCPPSNLDLNIPLASKKCACESAQQSRGYLYFIIKALKWEPRLNCLRCRLSDTTCVKRETILQTQRPADLQSGECDLAFCLTTELNICLLKMGKKLDKHNDQMSAVLLHLIRVVPIPISVSNMVRKSQVSVLASMWVYALMQSLVIKRRDPATSQLAPVNSGSVPVLCLASSVSTVDFTQARWSPQHVSYLPKFASG